MALLEVRGLEKWYGRRQVVNGVSYDVNRGEVVGLLGPNGAGKTTSFRMTIGLIDADGGKVLFDGRDVTNLPMYQRARAGMGYLAQDSSVFKQLSVEDNLMAILQTRRDMGRRQRKERQNELLDQFGLSRIRKTKANRVSGGERRRLEIARSLITEPKLIMLDEPFAGIDPKTVAEIQDQIRSLVETYNIGILLTDHNIRETLQVTDRSYVIRDGMVFAYGNPEQILNNADVRRHYIGDRFDVGHLLDQRRVHSIGETKGDPAPPPPTVPPGAANWDGPERDPAIAAPPTNPAPAVTPRADGVAGHDAALHSFVDPEAGPPAVGASQPPPAPGPGPLSPEDRAYMERFFGGSVTVLGDVVIEQMDVEVEPDPADGRRRPPG
jgi:lipopolysaccharide export system ATP-binding protein